MDLWGLSGAGADTDTDTDHGHGPRMRDAGTGTGTGTGTDAGTAAGRFLAFSVEADRVAACRFPASIFLGDPASASGFGLCSRAASRSRLGCSGPRRRRPDRRSS